MILINKVQLSVSVSGHWPLNDKKKTHAVVMNVKYQGKLKITHWCFHDRRDLWTIEIFCSQKGTKNHEKRISRVCYFKHNLFHKILFGKKGPFLTHHKHKMIWMALRSKLAKMKYKEHLAIKYCSGKYDGPVVFTQRWLL